MVFLIYDVLIVAVLAFFAVLGWRRGLLLSLCGLAVAIVAFLGAGVLADTLDDPVANAIQPSLASAIQESIGSHMESKPEGAAADPIDALRDMGGLYEWAADALAETRETMDSVVLGTIQGVARSAAQAIAVQIAHAILFVVAFVALFILLTVLLHVLDLVAKLPGLNFCNGLGGGVIGLIKGGIIVLVAVTALMASSFRPDPQTLESSYILRFFVTYNPILALFGG